MPTLPTSLRAPAAGLAVVLALGVAACTPEDREEIAGSIESAAEQAETEIANELASQQAEPEETQAAAATEEPAPTEEPEPTDEPEPTEEPADEGETTEWLPWLLALLAVVLVVALLAGAARRRREARQAAHARTSEQLGDIIGTGRWILDQGTTEAMRLSAPGQIERSWQATRQQMVGMEERLSRMHVDAEGDERFAAALRSTSEASAGLRSAVDADVARRVDTTSVDDPALAQSMRDTVQERRAAFRAALDQLSAWR